MIKKIKIILSKKQQLQFVILFFGILIAAILEMVGVGSIPIFINLLLKPEQVFSYVPPNKFLDFIINRDYLGQILIAGGLLLIIFLFKNIFIFFVNYMQTSLFQQIKIKNSKRLINAYLTGPYSLHLDRNPATIHRNVLGEVVHAAKFLDLLMVCMREILVVLVIFILLLLVDPITSLAVFSIIGFFAVIFNYITKKKITYLSKLSQVHRERQVKIINQIFGAIKDIKILDKEKYFINEFNNETKGAMKIEFFSRVINLIPRLSIEILGIAAILFVTSFLLFASGYSIEATIPILSLLGVATIRMIPSFNLLSGSIAMMRQTYVSFNLVVKELINFENHSIKKTHIETIDSNKIKLINKTIKIKNISFEYPNSNLMTLKNISFKIKPGSLFGIIGTTGAGKSTLIDLILGLLEPKEGEININGANIKKNYQIWQKQIGYIPQDIYIFDETIRSNVAFGVSDDQIDEKRVIKALKLAQISDFVLNLPKGLDTAVGNRGIRLSGGQRQRLGIARALYRQSKVLILDEATNSLDIETEKKLIKDIESLSGDYTIIIVTHRLSTIKNCDDVILLSQGKLLDQGTLDELISRHQNLKTDFLKIKVN
jgi:ATP-binding cassette, subfamily B, bacterial PglK